MRRPAPWNRRRRGCWRLNCAVIFAVLFITVAGLGNAAERAADEPPDAEYIRKMIPEINVGEYQGGRLTPLEVAGRQAYVVVPTGPVDPARRWIWIFPFWLGVNDGHGVLHHRWYVEQYLARGFHVAGVNVGTSCGSPAAAAVCHEFYQCVRDKYALHSRARLLVQSNGGLIGYAWASRHAEAVERIGGICPVTDFRTWPGLANVINFPEKGLDYGLSLVELTAAASVYNPIDRLAPLAREHVQILHIHGDADELVPMAENSTELARRYTQMGGTAQIVVLEGLGHGGKILYESQPLIEFLLEDCESLGLADVATGTEYLLRWELWGFEEAAGDDRESVDKRLESIELLIQPSQPFFSRLKSDARTCEIRGKLLVVDDEPQPKLSLTTSLVHGDGVATGEDPQLRHSDTETVTTTLNVSLGQSVTIGGILSESTTAGGIRKHSQRVQKVTLIRPCGTKTMTDK